MAPTRTKKTEKKKKIVLVTGVAGFIGFHLAQKLLSDGCTVVGIDSLSAYYDPRIKQKRLALLKKDKNFSFKKLDITKYEMLEVFIKKIKPDEIVHLAAQAGVRYSLKDPWTYLRTNELGTLNVFEAAHCAHCARVIYASSSSVYGIHAPGLMRETDQLGAPLSVYAATKQGNEALAHVYHHLYGMEMIGLRFFTVYGTWGRPDMAYFKFTKNILKGKPIDLYNGGKMARSFTHISDIVSGIVAAMKVASRGRYERYNLGGAEAVPLETFVSLIEKMAGKSAKRRLLPLQAGDVPETVADYSKAKRELQFEPKMSIEKGLEEFVVWFKENKKFLSSLQDAKQ